MDDELALALARCYDEDTAETWAVYADQLADDDEPRGELIALEQRLARGDADAADALWLKREQLLLDNSARWLGDEAAGALEAAREKGHPTLTWRFGYLRSLRLWLSFEADEGAARSEAIVAALLASDAARFLRTLSCEVAHASALAGVARAVARAPRPLRELELSAWHRSAPRAVIDAEGCAALAGALPELRVLRLHGAVLLATLAHESLQTLSLSGCHGIAALGVEPSTVSLPALRALDLALMVGSMDERVRRNAEPAERLAAIIADPGLGALRQLDLSRNHPGAHGGAFLGGSPPPIYEPAVLGAIGQRALRTLRLPTPVGDADAIERALRGAADALAAIDELCIPRLYTYHASLDAEALRAIVPSLRIDAVLPHRPSSSVHSREVLEVNDAEGTRSVWVGFASLMEAIESCYPELDAEHRATIDALIDAFEEIDYYDEGDGRPLRAELPRAPLLAALQAMGAEEESSELTMNRRVLELNELLRDERHDHVVIEKVWGW